MVRVSLWTAFFLILLRVCIGWHFFFEGYGKVKSAYQGQSTVNSKPFSSEAYFRESEGPFGKVMKKWMGDPDEELVAKLTLREVAGDSSKVSPKELFPEALDKEWTEYNDLFAKTFKISDEQKALASVKLDQAKADFVHWLQGVGPKDAKGKETKITLKVKRKSPTGAATDIDEEVTVLQRVAEFKKKTAEVKAVYAEKLPLMGKDVEGTKLRTLKGEATAMRGELQKELDGQTTKLKDSLAQLLPSITTYAKKADNADETATLAAMLTPMADGKNPLAGMWDAYASYAKDFSPDVTDLHKEQIDEQLKNAKQSFDRWLADQDSFTGKPKKDEYKEVAPWRKAYEAAVKAVETTTADEKAVPKIEKPTKEQEAQAAAVKQKKLDAETDLKLLTAQMQAALKQQSDALKTLLGTTLGDLRVKGYAPEDKGTILGFIPKWKPVQYVDWSTRWFLLIGGACLMVGLFTRLSAFSAAVFLLLTVLTQPSLPWLPAAPNNEGNYLFINKNVIEMVACFVLMTCRSGKWCGLDGILEAVFRKDK